MPELPEVETIKLGLQKRVLGLEIKNFEVREASLFKGEASDLCGAKIEKIWRRAKVLGIDFDNGRSLLIHLKMTGQLVYRGADEEIKVVGGHPQAEYNQPLPHKHTHIIINFSDGSFLYFNDLRKFGWMMIVPTDEVPKMKMIAELGAEPLDEKFDSQIPRLVSKIKRTKKSIKTLLMEQNFISGIGNIYANEILYFAGVRPDRLALSLSEEEIGRIFEEMPRVLRKALSYGGTSDSTYIGVDGERGDYLKHAAVYHKLTDPKGHKIEVMKINGRTAYFCPICQN